MSQERVEVVKKNELVASDEELLVFNALEILSSQLNQERSPRQAFLSWHSIEPETKINASHQKNHIYSQAQTFTKQSSFG